VSADKQTLLRLEKVRRCYGSTLAVDQVSFQVAKGEIFSLLGPSGCGKSTTLRLIAGLEESDSGEIWLNGRLIASPERGILVPAEKRNIGLVFQSYAVWPHMTVAQNVVYPLEVRRWDTAKISRRVGEVFRATTARAPAAVRNSQPDRHVQRCAVGAGLSAGHEAADRWAGRHDSNDGALTARPAGSVPSRPTTVAACRSRPSSSTGAAR